MHVWNLILKEKLSQNWRPKITYLKLFLIGVCLVAEYLGEKLAAFFGITTPRYQYVIDEFYRLKEQVRDKY